MRLWPVVVLIMRMIMITITMIIRTSIIMMMLAAMTAKPGHSHGLLPEPSARRCRQ